MTPDNESVDRPGRELHRKGEPESDAKLLPRFSLDGRPARTLTSVAPKSVSCAPGAHMKVPRTTLTRSRPRLLNLAALVGSLAPGLLHVRDVRAGSFTVTTIADAQGACTPSSCSLRAAIAAANALPAEASTITLPAGTYVLTIAQTLTLRADITIDGDGSATTIVDGNHLVRVFDNPADSASVQIDGLTVRNGNEASGLGGGGIHNVGTFIGSDLVLDSNTTTGQGGGLFNEGNAYLFQSVLRRNRAATGGGLANTGVASFLGSFTIDGNTSTAEGGGVWNSSFVSLDNSHPPVPPAPRTGGGTISSNAGTRGGGLYNNLGTVSLMNVALDGNTASADGAGYWNSGGEVHVVNATISRNVAGGNGGVLERLC